MGAPAVTPRSRPKPKARPKPPGRPHAAAPARKPRSAGPARKPRSAGPARKPRTAAPRTNHRSRSRITAGGNVALLPVNAVGGIADSGFVVGMSRSRAWIVVLGVLLGGIVALNVLGLSLSSSGSDAATKADELQQANSVLRARIANRTSNERIAEAAGNLGLSVPAPDAVGYLKARSGDAETAAKRLADGLIANAPPAITDPAAVALTDTAATTDPASAAVDPVTSVAVDPAVTTAAPADPAATSIVPTP